MYSGGSFAVMVQASMNLVDKKSLNNIAYVRGAILLVLPDMFRSEVQGVSVEIGQQPLRLTRRAS